MTSGPKMKEKELDSHLQALHSSSTEKRHAAIQALASASRTQPEVRGRLREVLAVLVQSVTETETAEVEVADAALRCIGNACADNTAGRDVMTEIGFGWTGSIFAAAAAADDGERNDKLKGLRELVCQVLYNICRDHEGAQKECYRSQVHYRLLEAWPKSRDQEDDNLNSSELRSQARDLLFWITGHKAELEPTLAEPLSEKTIAGIFDQRPLLRSAEGVEESTTGTEIILLYARDAVVQGQIARQKLLHKIRGIVEEQELLDRLEDEILEQEDLDLLRTQNASLVWCLSDIAAHPDFIKHYSLQDEIISAPRNSILAHVWSVFEGVKTSHDQDAQDANKRRSSSPSSSLFVADCQIIGNMLWALSPESYAEWAETKQLMGYALHEALLGTIALAQTREPSVDALFSIAGVLLYLARPSVLARRVVGECEFAPEALTRLCRHERQEIRHQSIKLLKALGKDCSENQSKYAELAREAMLSLQTPS